MPDFKSQISILLPLSRESRLCRFRREASLPRLSQNAHWQGFAPIPEEKRPSFVIASHAPRARKHALAPKRLGHVPRNAGKDTRNNPSESDAEVFETASPREPEKGQSSGSFSGRFSAKYSTFYGSQWRNPKPEITRILRDRGPSRFRRGLLCPKPCFPGGRLER